MGLFDLSYAQAASFDCTKSLTAVEALICSEPELSRLDDRLNKVYGEAKAKFKPVAALRIRQAEWVRRRNACEYDRGERVPATYQKTCIAEAYRQRIKEVSMLMTRELPCPELPLIGSEKEKGDCLKRVLQRQQLKLYKAFATTKKQKLCATLYRALVSSDPALEYIDPVVRTELTDHPALERYRQCSDKFNSDDRGNTPEDYFDGLYQNAHGFRVYQFHMRTGAGKEIKEYLYAEDNPIGSPNFPTNYVQVDFDATNCEVLDMVPVAAQEPRNTDHVLGLNAIVKYGASYYVLDYSDAVLTSRKFDQTRGRFEADMCTWK